MTNRTAPVLAYVDVYSRDEIIELVAADKLPNAGDSVTFDGGEHEGTWRICGVKPIADEVFDALVFMDRK